MTISQRTNLIEGCVKHFHAQANKDSYQILDKDMEFVVAVCQYLRDKGIDSAEYMRRANGMADEEFFSENSKMF